MQKGVIKGEAATVRHKPDRQGRWAKTQTLELLIERPLRTAGTALERGNLGFLSDKKYETRRYGIFKGDIWDFGKFMK